MEELLVIDKILDFLVPVKLRGKCMNVLMERGVKLLFLSVVAVIGVERILRKTIDAIGDTNQWSYAIGYMALYLFVGVLIYALVMGCVNMFISTIVDMKREKGVEETPVAQESDVVLEEECKTVVLETDAPRTTTSIKGGRPSQSIDDIFSDKAKGKEDTLKEFMLKIAIEDQNLVEGYADRLAKYFNTMVHLGIIDNNATAFARYFAKQCSAVSSDSYIRTFRNSKDRNPWDDESERILVNLMDS